MIGFTSRFGRSELITGFPNIHLVVVTLLACLLIFCLASDSLAIGPTGWYNTKIKAEYQFSDYGEYSFPEVEYGDSIQFIDPYIFSFPEHRSLVKIVQSFGPKKALELRYENSVLSSDKKQDRYYSRYDQNISDLTTVYGVYQNLGISYDSPDSTTSVGHMMSLGIKHDRSGWIKGETSFSYDNSKAPSGLVTETYMPMVQGRWSINSYTALSARWDGYWAVSDSGTVPAHAFTVFVSRYFPTETAVHLFSRFYRNEDGVESISPAVEVAQYVLWNLTARLTYRFYRNWFDAENAPPTIEGNSLTAHSIRTNIEYEIMADVKMLLKYRWYSSDQNIKMSTYLLGFEYNL